MKPAARTMSPEERREHLRRERKKMSSQDREFWKKFDELAAVEKEKRAERARDAEYRAEQKRLWQEEFDRRKEQQ